MEWTSIIALFALFWVLSAFLVMPFGMRTVEEEGHERVAGQVDSAPAQFRPGRIAFRATVLAAVLFGLFYANYVYGWIGVENLNLFGKPPAAQS
jgi:predicted secreted protein